MFTSLKDSDHINNEILTWNKIAGITRHITFSSARRTNAMLLLEHGADNCTPSERLDYKELKTNEIYAQIIDSKMKEVANLIPNITA